MTEQLQFFNETPTINYVDRHVQSLITTAAQHLEEAGVDTPQHDAKLLLAAATQSSLSDIEKALLFDALIDTLVEHSAHQVQENNQTDEDVLTVFMRMVARRELREPLQHIVGSVPFRYLELAVGPGVFIPRPETELVVQEAIDWITVRGLYSPRVVDLCAGSGAIGLAIATEIPGAQVWAVENDTCAAQWTRKNMQLVAQKYPDLTANYHLEVSDATCPITLAQLDSTVDVVISNPPYIPLTEVPQQREVRDYDPSGALYGGSADGMMIPEQIIVRAAALTRPGGLFVMEHDISQGDRTVAFARANGFMNASTHYDLSRRPRYLVATK